MRRKIKQPFVYGNYLIEYREKPGGLLKILKEKIDTFDEACQKRDELLLKGYESPTIHKVG